MTDLQALSRTIKGLQLCISRIEVIEAGLQSQATHINRLPLLLSLSPTTSTTATDIILIDDVDAGWFTLVRSIKLHVNLIMWENRFGSVTTEFQSLILRLNLFLIRGKMLRRGRNRYKSCEVDRLLGLGLEDVEVDLGQDIEVDTGFVLRQG
jgi:hypothetical protein